MAGGTMGVVYGAAGLWQWKKTIDEPGWDSWTDNKVSWKEALDLEGSNYVGYVSKVFSKVDASDIEKRPDLSGNSTPVLAIENKLYLSYLPTGGEINISSVPEGISYRWFDPTKGVFLQKGITEKGKIFNAPDKNPWVLVIGDMAE
jgi:hypothetical protein